MNKLHHSVYRKAHRSFRINAPLHRNSCTVYFRIDAPFDRNLQPKVTGKFYTPQLFKIYKKKARRHFSITQIVYRRHFDVIHSIDLLFLQLHWQVLSHHLPYYIFQKKFLLCSLQFLAQFPLQLKHGKFVCAYYHMQIL